MNVVEQTSGSSFAVRNGMQTNPPNLPLNQSKRAGRKIESSALQTLVLKESTLVPGIEWAPAFAGWAFIHLTQGPAYWLDSRMKRELPVGAVLILSPRIKGVIRSSQLGAALCHYFYVDPRKLAGLVTLPEQRRLEEASLREYRAIQLLEPLAPLACDFRKFCNESRESAVRSRLYMVDLFVRAFKSELTAVIDESSNVSGAKSRLEGLLRTIPAADLVDLQYGELVSRVGCGPRHFGRIFQQLVGMSFREKQAEVRLDKARDLLAATESKILEIAIESGYQSLSLFNFMFKKRFGTTPGQWRRRVQQRKVSL